MIHGKISPVSNLTEKQIQKMFEVMQKYYENMEWNNFYNDLICKLDVILLRDNTGSIKGFTTLAMFEYNKNIRLLFSGDTIVEQEYWGANDLQQVWVKNAIKHAENFDGKTYWLLLSKGYKSYKYLYTFFNEFYPRADVETPEFALQIIDNFCKQHWPEKYQDGVIKMGKDHLKTEFAEMEEFMLKDKDIAFFLEKNPNFAKGDELVCLTEMSIDNLNRLGRMALGK